VVEIGIDLGGGKKRGSVHQEGLPTKTKPLNAQKENAKTFVVPRSGRRAKRSQRPIKGEGGGDWRL